MMRLNPIPFETQLGNKTLYRDMSAKNKKNNNTQVAYYSGIDAEIYFGDHYVDEIAQIQFQVQQNVIPLIGYNSYTYDELAVGSRIVSGSFAVNFTKAGYLYDILQALSGSIINAKSLVVKTNESTVQDFDENQALKVSAQENSSSLEMQNPLFAQRHSPLWNKTFDIVVSYGDSVETKSPYSTTITLAGVQITGCQQQLSYEGQPAMEMYTFIANDMYTTPDLSFDTASGVKPEEIVSKYEPEVPTFMDFQYSEETGAPTTYWEPIYGTLRFKCDPSADNTIEKVLIELKSIGINSTKEVPIGSDQTSFVYSVTTEIAKAMHGYQTPTKRDLEVKIYCQYKNKTLKSSIHSEERCVLKADQYLVIG